MAIDRRERANQFQLAIDAAVAGLRADMWTAMPGIVQSYDATKQTVSVQVAIQAQVQDKEGKWSNTTISVLPDVPVEWPGGGGYCMTFPLAAGDEGLIVFCSRCINAWWSQGGVQPQEELRMHDLSDGIFIPRLRSKPNITAPPPSTATAQLRSDDGAVFVELAAGHIVNVTAPGGITLNGPVTATQGLSVVGAIVAEAGLAITGGLTADTVHATNTVAADGAVTSKSDITAGVGTADQVGLRTHSHFYNAGPNSATPLPPPTPGT